MGKTVLIALLLVACASVGFAQSSDYKKVEVYGGFSHNRIDEGGSLSDHTGFNGFETSVTGNITRYVGLKFDFSGHFKNRTLFFGPGSEGSFDSAIYNFLGGVQLKDNASEGTFKPFAHALVGAARTRNKITSNGVCATIPPSPCPNFTFTDTGWAGAFGGGLDIRLNHRFDIRAIQVDYNPTRVSDFTRHNFRIGAGIVIH